MRSRKRKLITATRSRKTNLQVNRCYGSAKVRWISYCACRKRSVYPCCTTGGAHIYNAYTFEVNRMAGKDDIRRAVEELFDVKVIRVNTQNRHGKPRRTRFRWGTTKAWKKAVVTLDSEHRIDFF